MSRLDDIKAKASGLLEGSGDKITEGLGKVRELAQEKSGGDLGAQVKSGIQKAKDALGGKGGAS